MNYIDYIYSRIEELKKENKHETAEELIERLKSLPNPDLTDPEVVRDFAERLAAKTDPEIEKAERLQKRTGGWPFRRY